MKKLILGCTLFMLFIFLFACGKENGKITDEDLDRDAATNQTDDNEGSKTDVNIVRESNEESNDVNKDEENNTNEELSDEMNAVYTASSDNVKQLGRTYYSDKDILWCAFSGTGAEFKFTGKKCTVNITGDSVSLTNQTDNHARIGIYVNGNRVVDDMVDKWQKEYVVIDEDEITEATVRIVKLSETAMSTFGIASIKVEEGKIEPTEEKNLFIEFIGDSITCGYGVDDEDRDHHFSTKTEDITRAYAYKTAEKLDADYSMVAISGYGIISGYTTADEPNSEQTIPQYYETLGFSYGGFGTEKPQDIKWDFSKRQPDIIVINLGTNDNSYTKGIEDRVSLFGSEYGKFLKKVRELNLASTIICSLGIMGGQLYPTIENTVNAFINETGDNKIELLRFDEQSPQDGYAADWHPTEATHTKASEKLAAKIREILDK